MIKVVVLEALLPTLESNMQEIMMQYDRFSCHFKNRSSEQFITVVLLLDTVVIHKYIMLQLLFKGDHSHQHSQKGNSIKSSAISVPANVFNSCKKQWPNT